MVKVCVLQTDNRPQLDYLLKTQNVNKKFCKYACYEYVFIELENNKYGNIHPATKKIHIVTDFLNNTECDILVFLDSDAWIQNISHLDSIINNLFNNDTKQGCFSRDPYVQKNTFINSGSFIIKNNDFTKKMYNDIIKDLYSNNTYHNIWPFDQYYISNYVFENRDKFTIFVPDILNTPLGKVLKHNWCKNTTMYDDLNKLISLEEKDLCNNVNVVTPFFEKDYYDKENYPNTEEIGYEYMS